MSSIDGSFAKLIKLQVCDAQIRRLTRLCANYIADVPFNCVYLLSGKY